MSLCIRFWKSICVQWILWKYIWLSCILSFTKWDVLGDSTMRIPIHQRADSQGTQGAFWSHEFYILFRDTFKNAPSVSSLKPALSFLRVCWRLGRAPGCGLKFEHVLKLISMQQGKLVLSWLCYAGAVADRGTNQRENFGWLVFSTELWMGPNLYTWHISVMFVACT